MDIGVIGCANIAMRSVIPAIKSIGDFNLIAVASRNFEKATEYAQKFECEAIEGYDNLIAREDIEAVYIPLPTGMHQEFVVKALQSGKHVIAEKSLGMNFSEVDTMVNLAREKNLLLMENYMFEYHSQHKFVFDLINNNEIGEIRLFRSTFGFPPLPKNNFRYDKKLGGGSLLDAAGYPIKAAQIFLGNNITVKASNLFIDKSLDVDIFGSAYLSSNSYIAAEIGFGFDNFYQCNYELWGSKGKITAERAFTPQPTFSPKIILEKDNDKKEFLIEPDNHFVNILKEFYRAATQRDFERHYTVLLNQAKLQEEIRLLSTKNFIN
ncbi:MAG: Gfo/Idh/MocA family oxidoreductase [Ignavibacteria bacterium]|nr:Gfo/Idh/MocA family oxidoreductase [Ignavibacteria bacterium]